MDVRSRHFLFLVVAVAFGFAWASWHPKVTSVTLMDAGANEPAPAFDRLGDGATLDFSRLSVANQADAPDTGFSKATPTGIVSRVVAAKPGQGVRKPQVSGELKVWHKITLTFDGPYTRETAIPNPFTDYRLEVTFSKGSRRYRVPGYYAADGNAAHTSATDGNKWRVHFIADGPGLWEYEVSFRTGKNIAINGDRSAGTPVAFDGAKGSITVTPTDKGGRDHRAIDNYISNVLYLGPEVRNYETFWEPRATATTPRACHRVVGSRVSTCGGGPQAWRGPT